jgi:molybdopterin/thiamine biosynthesis adenylyltransferase/rhodanese-related sulfurtransferase
MSEHQSVPVETPVEEAAGRISASCPLFDIRTANERQTGMPSGAIAITVEDLLQQCSSKTPGVPTSGWIMCAEGIRSLEAVQQLRELGFCRFSSVSSGYKGWRSAGLPVNYPAGLNADQAERYARHLVMPQVGAEGQRKLLDSRVLLVGLGGLNSPVAMYLAAAGVGTLGLVDFDTVERSNLQRQVLHGESRLGELKAESARQRIRDINPGVVTVVADLKVTPENAADLVRDWDVVIDGTDSFESRYALNAACVQSAKPLVYGAVMRFQGQVSVFWPASDTAPGSPCFRCMMPLEPAAGEAPGCAEAGVLGILPGIIGTLQANEALKLILGIGQSLIGELLMVDALNMEFRKMRIPVNPSCESCGLKSPG